MGVVLNPLFKELDLQYKATDELNHDIALRTGVSHAAFLVLYHLWELGDGCLQKDICSRCFLSKQTIHSAVNKLVKNGLLLLRPGKGRDMHLLLTEQGHTFLEEKIIPVAEAENEAISSLTAEEQEELVRLNQKYVKLLYEKTRHLV